MNGGLEAMLDRLTAEEVRRAIDGFLYFGENDVASVLGRAAELGFGGEGIAELQARYWQLIPNDGALEAVLRRRLHDAPEDFAPVPAI